MHSDHGMEHSRAVTDQAQRSRARAELDRQLNRLMNDIPGAEKALLGAGDGLKLSHTAMPQDDADRMAATITGMLSLAQHHFKDRNGRTRQAIYEHDGAYLFVIHAGLEGADLENTVLAVEVSISADVGLVGHQMKRFIRQLQESLVIAARHPNLSPQQ
ncbi:roadblock/LC7 domain-containing protein [Streptomyces sp. NPDC058284]|uniref:roadblock/LC7 domain-containing protein n=1 Tax=unclassified Streptomyces TaxID=2593676 RepID=UPI00365EC5B0